MEAEEEEEEEAVAVVSWSRWTLVFASAFLGRPNWARQPRFAREDDVSESLATLLPIRLHEFVTLHA